MKPYIVIEEDDGYIDETFYALYAGEDLNTKYPDSYYFYLYIYHADIWERHAYRKDVKYRPPRDDEKYDFIKFILGSRGFTIST